MAVAERLTETTRQQWIVEGRCPGGEVGAYFVSSGNDCYVMKWSERSGALTDLAVTVEWLRQLHRSGFPMPRYEQPIAIDGAVVVVQERIDHGRAEDRVSVNLVEQLLTACRLRVGVTEPSKDWTQFIRSTLLEGADGWCLHQTLAEYSPETRKILSWATSIGQEVDSLPCGDLVHVDFHHRNVLQAGGELVAVIDWEGPKLATTSLIW